MGSPYQTVAFHTLGCKLNYAETSTLERIFINSGYQSVNFFDSPNVYVINSCSVTDNADQKVRKVIRQALKNSPLAHIAIVGCYAQLKPEEISKIPGVSLVVGTEEKFNLPKHIERINLSSKTKIINSNIKTVGTFEPSHSFGKRTRSYLKIQDGCDYNCSFCTIPMARGKSRSATISDVILKAEEIVNEGALEIVLTGVNIGDFGVGNNQSFIELLEELEKIKGNQRYRISSIEPNLLTDEIIQFIAFSEKFLPHFHIPLQSGSDHILKLMRRRYAKDYYQSRINIIKSKLPDSSIGVDVIVGFPGESDVHFQETYDFLNEMDISYLHVFSYSERDNTESINIMPKVHPKEIIKRSKMLRSLSNKKKNKFYNQNNGRLKNILIESYEAGLLSGLTENYIRVKAVGNINEVNTIIPFRMVYDKEGEMRGHRLT